MSNAMATWAAGLGQGRAKGGLVNGKGGRVNGKGGRMKVYTATISKEALENRSRSAYYRRQKLLVILVVTLVSVIPLVGISFFSFRYYENSWINRTSSELGGLADSRRQLIETFLAGQDNMLASLTGLYSADYLSQQPNLDKIFTEVNRNGLITDMNVIGMDGVARAYVGPFAGQLAGVNYASADWFKQTVAEGRYTSDVFTGFRGVPHIVVAVVDPSRQVILRATVNSDMFNSLLSSAEVGAGGDAFLINASGEPQTPSRLGDTSTPFGPAEAAAAAGSVSVSRSGDYIYAVTGLKDGDWALVLKEDTGNSLSEFFKARKSAIVLIMLAIVLIGSVATLLISSIINRIKEADRQRTALNERMREVEKLALMGRLSASVAHEINNPLQIIDNQAGWIGELLDDEKDAPPVNYGEYRESVAKIKSHVSRASAITHRLLDFSHAGERQARDTDVNRLIEETVSFLGDEARSRDIAIGVDLQKALPHIVSHPAQLQQVFLNIINNAIDAIRRGGTIGIRTRSVDGAVVAEFRDSGPGLPEEVRDHIFEPFFSTKDGGGAGLGLSISYNIIQRLGGDIEARNREQGGSIFTITLPVVKQTAQYIPEESR